MCTPYNVLSNVKNIHYYRYYKDVEKNGDILPFWVFDIQSPYISMVFDVPVSIIVHIEQKASKS